MAKVEPGTVVGGKYRLEEPIGEGGMGSVWRATHTTLESPVAVKLLELYGSRRDEMIERFFREAKLAANLKHRNVLHILDFGTRDDDGQPFMVMELLHGESLGDRLEREEQPDEVAMMDTVAQLLGGLAAVHDAGIVHRDVKPDNVFLVKDADGEYPKLLDFGVSKSEGSARVTATGAVIGTPAYMSPEQAMGHDDLDPRSDLFSVGVMLYEILAGEIPFESPRMGEILIRVATEDMPPLTEYRPDLPPALVDVVMKAVAREREARWSDARDMRDALLTATDVLAESPRRGTRPVRASVARRARTDASAETLMSDSLEALIPADLEEDAPPTMVSPDPSPPRSGPPRAVLVGIAAGVLLVAFVGGVVVMSALRGPAEVEPPASAGAEPTPLEPLPEPPEPDDALAAAASPTPEPSEAPEPSEVPEPSGAPEPSAAPSPAPEPAASPTPEPSEAPEPAAPSPAPAPAPVAAPSPAPSPAPVAAPAPAPRPRPAPRPTIAPPRPLAPAPAPAPLPAPRPPRRTDDFQNELDF